MAPPHECFIQQRHCPWTMCSEECNGDRGSATCIYKIAGAQECREIMGGLACELHQHRECVQADKSRVKDYIHRLDNFDGPAVGEIAVGYEMFDEAFEIYKKFGLKTQAIKVLLDNHEDLERALEYATKVCAKPPGSVPLALHASAQLTAVSVATWQPAPAQHSTLSGYRAAKVCASIPMSQPEMSGGLCCSSSHAHLRRSPTRRCF